MLPKNLLLILTLLGMLAPLCGEAAGGAKPQVSLTLRNELAYDQQSERITVYIDDARVGEMALDEKRPRAELRLDLHKPVHSYRLEGETVLEGTRYRIDGAGLIVTSARMDEIAEGTTAVEAVVAFRALADELRAAAPAADLGAIAFVPGTKADPAAIAAAERRLAIDLPTALERLLREVGAFRLGNRDYTAGAVLGADTMATVVDFYVRRVRENGWDDLDEEPARIRKRFPASGRDVVLDWFELDEPTVLVAGKRCPNGQIAIALPGSDFDLIGTDPGDNPFMALIDYEDDIMGEAECIDYNRLLAYRLHDHIVEMGEEALFVRNEDTRYISFYRQRTDNDHKLVWLRFTDADE